MAAKNKLRSCLCDKCEGMVFGLLNELRNEAKESRRGGLIIDCINDLQNSLENGNIDEVILRDSAYKSGNRVGRRLKISK